MKRTSTSLLVLGLVLVLTASCAVEGGGPFLVTDERPDAPRAADVPAASQALECPPQRPPFQLYPDAPFQRIEVLVIAVGR